jgi:hypothetical protein
MKSIGFADPLQQHALPGPAFLQNSWAPERHVPHEVMVALLGFDVMNRSE